MYVMKSLLFPCAYGFVYVTMYTKLNFLCRKKAVIKLCKVLMFSSTYSHTQDLSICINVNSDYEGGVSVFLMDIAVGGGLRLI